tara:strand:+ start:360 stop:926 length:567 start_codon:yes stop_codon:yes gene_type:complete
MIKVYLANRPPLPEYQKIPMVGDLPLGEIKRIGTETGNHWRKIFNVYAKLMYRLAEKTNDEILLSHSSWQQYRDHALLQLDSGTELHFSPTIIIKAPRLEKLDAGAIHLVMGKAFAEEFLAATLANATHDGLAEDPYRSLQWLDNDFALHRTLNIIVCPYFDYRQLSNQKIETLVELIISLQNKAGMA